MRYRNLLCACASLSLCGWSAAAENVTENRAPEDPLILAVARASSDFAADVYGRLQTEPGNLVFAPLSLAQSLLPVAAGARDSAGDVVLRTLHLGLPVAEAGDGFAALERRLEREAGGAKRAGVARALWLQQWNSVEGDFVETLRRHCRAEFRVIDFSRQEYAAHWINRWVSDRTDDRVRAIVAADSIAPDSCLFVGSAVYFEADWAVDFDPALTAPDTFWVPVAPAPVPPATRAGEEGAPAADRPAPLADAPAPPPVAESADAPGGAVDAVPPPASEQAAIADAPSPAAIPEPAPIELEAVEVPMMRRVGALRVARAHGFEMVQVPYRNDQLAFVALVPTKGSSLSEAGQAVTGEVLRDCLARLEAATPARVELRLPRLTINQLVPRLDAALRELGAADVFDQSGVADFSGLGTNLQGEPIYLSAVRQMVVLSLDERGVDSLTNTPAAAYDAPVEAPVAFPVDRPFLYVICDRPTGAILFWGRVVDPRQR